MSRTMNDQIKRLNNAGYEVSFSQRNPHAFACDLYGPLGHHHEAAGDSPAAALEGAVPPELVTDSGPIRWDEPES